MEGRRESFFKPVIRLLALALPPSEGAHLNFFFQPVFVFVGVTSNILSRFLSCQIDLSCQDQGQSDEDYHSQLFPLR